MKSIKNLQLVLLCCMIALNLHGCGQENSGDASSDKKSSGIEKKILGVWAVYSSDLEFGLPEGGLLKIDENKYISYRGSFRKSGSDWDVPSFTGMKFTSIESTGDKHYFVTSKNKIPFYLKDGVLSIGGIHKKYYKATPRVEQMYANLVAFWKDKKPTERLWDAIKNQNVDSINKSLKNGAWVNANNRKEKKTLLNFASSHASTVEAILPIYKAYLGGVNSRTITMLKPDVLEQLLTNEKLSFVNKKQTGKLFKALFKKNVKLAEIYHSQLKGDVFDLAMFNNVRKDQAEKWAFKKKVFTSFKYDKKNLAEYVRTLVTMVDDEELLSIINKTGIDYSRTRYEHEFTSTVQTLALNKAFKSLLRIIETNNVKAIGRKHNNDGNYNKITLALIKFKQEACLKIFLSERYGFSKIGQHNKKFIYDSLIKNGFSELAKSLQV